MVKQGIVLGHVISHRGIQVDKAKVDLISNLPPPRTVKEVHCSLFSGPCRILPAIHPGFQQDRQALVQVVGEGGPIYFL
jgi:hypothetical protein